MPFVRDIDEEFLDEPRTDALCQGLRGRVRQLEQLASQQRQHKSTEPSHDE